MSLMLVCSSYNLPGWQVVKLTFFKPITEDQKVEGRHTETKNHTLN